MSSKKNIINRKYGNWYLKDRWSKNAKQTFSFLQICFFGEKVRPEDELAFKELGGKYPEVAIEFAQVVNMGKKLIRDVWMMDLHPKGYSDRLFECIGDVKRYVDDLVSLIEQYGDYNIVHLDGEIGPEVHSERLVAMTEDHDFYLTSQRIGMPLRLYLLLLINECNSSALAEWSGIKTAIQPVSYRRIQEFFRKEILGMRQDDNLPRLSAILVLF